MKALRHGRDGECVKGFPSWWSNALDENKI